MPEPIGLLDLGPDYKLVKVREGAEIKVYGISTEGVFNLLRRFAGLQQLLGKQVGFGMGEIVAVPGALGAIVAEACGNGGDTVAEANASRLPMSVQIEVFKACWRLTFTEGFGPFVTSMQEFGALASDQAGKEPPMNSPKPSPRLRPSPTPAQPSGT